MNPKNKKLDFLGFCGILLKEQAQVTPEKTSNNLNSLQI